MTIKESLKQELKREAATTRNLLASVPFEKLDYKPHQKSMSLNQLTKHLAEINGWWETCLLANELDFAKYNNPTLDFKNTEDLLAFHDRLTEKALNTIDKIDEKVLEENWTMRNGDMVFFSMPKGEVVRTWCMNHLYHHRGQLSVYLRLLDVPLPSIYGPTADTQ